MSGTASSVLMDTIGVQNYQRRVSAIAMVVGVAVQNAAGDWSTGEVGTPVLTQAQKDARLAFAHKCVSSTASPYMLALHSARDSVVQTAIIAAPTNPVVAPTDAQLLTALRVVFNDMAQSGA